MASANNNALFINGIFRTVLDKILETQAGNPDHTLFLQPESGSPIVMLKNSPPTPEDPVTLYASTTDDLSMVSYTAEIANWEDKTTLSQARIEQVNGILVLHQQGEGTLYDQSHVTDKRSINLLSIRRLTKLPEPFSVGQLVKVRDGKPLSTRRTRAGGWSVVQKNTASEVA